MYLKRAVIRFLNFRTFVPVSYTNKTKCYYITEILLKVALNTITIALNIRQHDPSNQHYGVRAKVLNQDNVERHIYHRLLRLAL
jgi:hypothetical protein